MYHSHLLDHHVIKLKEVSKLHLSTALMNFGSGLVGIFIPIYLYELGYSVKQIAIFYLVIQLANVVADILAAALTAKIGPKHTIRISLVFRLLGLLTLFVFDEQSNFFWVLAVVLALQGSMMSLPYFVEFSKLSELRGENRVKKSGKQLGRSYVATKIGAALGPLVGGILITQVSIKINLAVALITVFASAVILNGHELTATRQKINFLKFDITKVKPDLLGAISIGWSFITSGTFLALFFVVYISTDSQGYTLVGIVSTLSLVLSLGASVLAGKMSDGTRAWMSARFSYALFALVDIARIFALTPITAAIINLPSESAGVGIRVPMFKSMFDSVNKLEGFRITYWLMMLVGIDLMRATFWLLFIIGLTLLEDEKTTMQIMFALTAITGLIGFKTRKLYGVQ